MPSGKHLISVSGDGCIFVWKLTFQTAKPVTKSGEIMSIPTSSSIWQDSRYVGHQNTMDNNYGKISI
ncbi:WD repeat-containing protein 55 homolog [Caerostris extrusa]|uniref:WD repeat-containing protein 55 homolog n=1 Tax=Caerostris extrusa TaxID=172846 RepID=A0AAV4P4C8_CAEEX|nr:WD repeat-containing protein 55 homolog [Caerostris extrusa]